MTSTTTTLPKPTSKSLLRGPSMLNQAKPISFLRFPASKSDFFGSKNKALSKTVTELVRISVFRASYGGNSEESTGSFQQGDVIIHGPHKFQSVLSAGGLEATLNCLSKWLVVTFSGAVILGRHDAKAMWAALGLVVNSILSVILKRTFNHERPDSTLRSDPGMPSSHGQSIFFTLVFAILSVGEWLGVNEFTLILSAFMLAFGTYLTWLRVSQGLHTINQAVVGAAVGSIFSILWFWSWDAFVLKAFISSLWVRMVVVMGAAVFCLALLVYVIGYLFNDK
ncbi:hypothetical protein Peur_050236 [Populus x canadensis]|uniref:Phosphatidic acid phosphatase type 2/haloperoxidase domain-containing protein n=1 Tax=Populus deltoides TaxID=3696 RepID=A0A8T2WI63_POPDE|nr:hypothetical protein H0E87_010648 [Populus deltoides]